MAITLRIISYAGVETSVRVQRLLSVDDVPFGATVSPDLLNHEHRIRCLESLIGDLLSPLQPQPELYSAVSSSQPEAPSHLPVELHQPTPEELLTGESQVLQDLVQLVDPKKTSTTA